MQVIGLIVQDTVARCSGGVGVRRKCACVTGIIGVDVGGHGPGFGVEMQWWKSLKSLQSIIGSCSLKEKCVKLMIFIFLKKHDDFKMTPNWIYDDSMLVWRWLRIFWYDIILGLTIAKVYDKWKISYPYMLIMIVAKISHLRFICKPSCHLRFIS